MPRRVANDRCFGPDSAEHCLEVQVLDEVGLPVALQRQVFWSRQCRTLFGGAGPGRGWPARRVATTGGVAQTVQTLFGGAGPGRGWPARRVATTGVLAQTVQNTVWRCSFLDEVGMPVVLQRQVFWPRQCITLFGGAGPGRGWPARRVATTGAVLGQGL